MRRHLRTAATIAAAAILVLGLPLAVALAQGPAPEAPAAPVLAALETAAAHSGFVIERSNIEALGLCPACKVAA